MAKLENLDGGNTRDALEVFRRRGWC